MGEFRMPSLGADMDAGTITEWLVKPGDHVQRGDIVAVVDTEKADIEVEIFEDGVVEEILVPVGVKVPVGTPLATLARVDAVASAPPAAAPASSPSPSSPSSPPLVRPAPSPTPAVPVTPPVPATPAGAVHSPVLRRLARHLGVDLGKVEGTGPGGVVTRADIEAAAGSAPAPIHVEPQLAAPAARDVAGDRESAMRAAIARLMARSKREIPHYYLAADVDFSTARTWLDDTNMRRPVTDRLLPAALLIRAVALAARAEPAMNGFWLDDRYQPADAVHVGVAVALRGGGLIAPAIHDADRKSLEELMQSLLELVARARNGRLRSSEMSEPTITVTNLGDQGVEAVYGVIYPPQVALVGFGRITERPWAENGMLGVRPVVSMTLAADHRASDGHTGARFLSRIDHLLQTPEEP